MINNNIPQNPNVNTGSAIESSIYLKKSDLPKNISAFNNDKGYILSSSLEVWMMKHSYMPKPEIEKLIKKANIEVIDIVNKSTDGEAISKLDGYIKGINQEIVEIKDKLNDIGINDISKINSEIDIINNNIKNIENNSKNYLTEHQSLEGYATEQWVNEQKYIKEIPSDISYFTNDTGYLTSSDLKSYATQNWVKSRGYITEHQSLEGYVKKTDIKELTKDFVKGDDIPEIPTKLSQFINDKGYITEHQSLDGYVKKTDIPKFDNIATKTDIPIKLSQLENDKGYLTKHQSLIGYVKESSLSTYVKKSELNNTLRNYAVKNNVYSKSSVDNIISNYLKIKDADNMYYSKDEIKDKYMTIVDANNSFLRIADYRGIKDATTINDEYMGNSLAEFENNLDKIGSNGFYIVNKNDIVIVKDHKILNIFKDGVPQVTLQWTEEI